MSHKGLGLLILSWCGVALLAGGGCRMCASPYDHCSPLVACPAGACDPFERAGSVWSGRPPQLTHQNAPAKNPPKIEGMEDIVAQQPLPPIRILSITDRKLGESEPTDNIGKQDGSLQISRVPSFPAENKPANADGWTAIR